MTYYDQVIEAAAFLMTGLRPLQPKIGIVLGSGLGAVAEAVPDPIVVPYAEVPHFPQSTVEGHSGRIVAGSRIPRLAARPGRASVAGSPAALTSRFTRFAGSGCRRP